MFLNLSPQAYFLFYFLRPIAQVANPPTAWLPKLRRTLGRGLAFLGAGAVLNQAATLYVQRRALQVGVMRSGRSKKEREPQGASRKTPSTESPDVGQ